MNDRIREIAEEHGFIHEYMTIGERNDALTKYREFAKLIVQECSLTVQDFVDRRIPASEYPDRLKHHFGVEE